MFFTCLFFIVRSLYGDPCIRDYYFVEDKGGILHCIQCPCCPPGLEPGHLCDQMVLYNDTIELECNICSEEYFNANYVSMCQPFGRCSG